MPSTQERIASMAKEQLGLNDPAIMNTGLSEAGVSSMAAVAFLRAVIEETGVEITAEQFAAFPTLRALADYIDSNSE